MAGVSEGGVRSDPASPTDAPRRPQDHFTVSPFARLARTHALSTAGDAMVATALAGTIFFEGATSQARGKVFLYLLLTMAPFALVAPLIGPALDRARTGRRWMIVGSAVLRAGLVLFMLRDVQSLWFYPEAFAVLVLQKGYAIARSAVVPTTIKSDAELVEANSKLSLISGLMSFIGAAPAALLFRLGGPKWTLGLAAFVYLVTGLVATRMVAEPVAKQAADGVERAELRSIGVVLAASAIGLIRGIVGFLTLLLAFDFRRHGVPKWHFALVAGVSVSGGLVGAVLAPRLRKVATEERMIVGAMGVIFLAGMVAFAVAGVAGGAIMGLAVGVGAGVGKLAFDSIVQRDAPDANRGRSFAKFETRFQMLWVIGALIGLIDMPVRIGFLIILVVAAFAAGSYGLGSLAWKHRTGTQTPVTEAAVEIEARIIETRTAAQRSVARWFKASRAGLNARWDERRGKTARPVEGAEGMAEAGGPLPAPLPGSPEAFQPPERQAVPGSSGSPQPSHAPLFDGEADHAATAAPMQGRGALSPDGPGLPPNDPLTTLPHPLPSPSGPGRPDPAPGWAPPPSPSPELPPGSASPAPSRPDVSPPRFDPPPFGPPPAGRTTPWGPPQPQAATSSPAHAPLFDQFDPTQPDPTADAARDRADRGQPVVPGGPDGERGLGDDDPTEQPVTEDSLRWRD